MNHNLLKAAAGGLLIMFALKANAQKNYTKGVITLSTKINGIDVEPKEYFTTDSAALVMKVDAWGVNIKTLADAKGTYFAMLIDAPAASLKKAGIATADDIKQIRASDPQFSFAPTTETKQISGFNCKKVLATDTKSKKTYDVWITNDVLLPENVVQRYFSTIGGVPIQYPTFQRGQESMTIVKQITDEIAPKGTYNVPADYDKVTFDELNSMGGNNR